MHIFLVTFHLYDPLSLSYTVVILSPRVLFLPFDVLLYDRLMLCNKYSCFDFSLELLLGLLLACERVVCVSMAALVSAQIEGCSVVLGEWYVIFEASRKVRLMIISAPPIDLQVSGVLTFDTK